MQPDCEADIVLLSNSSIIELHWGVEWMGVDENILRSLIYRYEMANFTFERRLNARMRDILPEELTVEQFKTIRYLKHNGTSTSSELSEIFCVGRSSITAIVSRLSDKGLIERLPEEKDRRVINLALTEEGDRICGLMEEQVLVILTGMISHFDEKEAFSFVETYEKLAKQSQKS